MTALAHDDRVVFYWAPTVAGVAPAYAPTVANITAAVRILGITNYEVPATEAEVDTSDIDSMYDTAVVGTTKAGPLSLTMKRDDTSEAAGWDVFDTPREAGFLIRSFDGPAILASVVEVYPAQVGQRRPEGYARNTVQKFVVSFYVTAEPNMNAVVAA